MRIKRVHVKNFRCILDEGIDFEKLTVLVGPNGAGKSAFLRAIRVFYDTTLSVSQEDYYNRDNDAAIEIAVTFDALTEEENELYRPYLDHETLTVTKIIRGSEVKYHGTRLQNPDFEGVRRHAGKRDRRSAYAELRGRPEYGELPTASSADAADRALQAWENEHPERCQMRPDDGQFFGFRQVGQARLERHTRYVFVPAVREASNDAADARGSAIHEIMELVVRSVLARNEDFTSFKSRTQAEYDGLIDPKVLPQLGQLGKDLTRILRDYVPAAAVLLRWLEADDLTIPMPRASTWLEEDGFRTTVDRAGHGLQRAFILSLLQQLAAAQAEQPVETEESPDGEAAAGALPERLPHLILGIEEPELYQHPNRQRHLTRVLWQLAEGRIQGVAASTQVIYCTHSPLLVDLVRFHCVRRLTKVPDPELGPVADDDTDRPPLITRVAANSLEAVAGKLEKAQDTPPRTPFTAESISARLATLLTPWVNEGFFGDVVVLVEGADDYSAIAGAALRMGRTLDSEGIAVIPCAGKNNIDRIYLIFSGLHIPTYVVWDGDADSGTEPGANRRLQRLLGVEDPQDFPPTEVGAHYAVFEDELESAIRAAIGDDIFRATADAFKATYGYPDDDSCRKSPLFFKSLLEQGAKQGRTVPELEQIIERVSALRPSPPVATEEERDD